MNKIDFVNNGQPAINDINLNQMQTNIENAIDDRKPIRTVLFNDSSNTSLTIELSESAYNYSYLYINNSSNYYVMVPMWASNQSSLRGIGGWSGNTNVGSTHFYGTLSEDGKTLTVNYFTAMVHKASGNHNAGDDYDVKMVVGVR